MKTFYKKILPYLLTFEILIVSFFSYSIPAYAADFVAHDIIEAVEYGIEYKDWTPFWDFLYSTSDGLMYLYSQMGAIVNKNFQEWVNNNKALESLAETVPTPAKKDGENIVFTKEFMAELKALIEQYAKENEPYYIVPVASYKDIDPSQFSSKAKYNTLCNLAKKYKLIGVNGHSADMTVTDLSDFYKDGCSIVFTRSYFSTTWQSTEYWGNIYNSDWSRKDYYYYSFTFDADDVGVGGYTSLEEGRYALDGGFSEVRHTEFCVNYPLCYGGKIRNDTATISAVRLPCLVSDTGGRMRVYRTVDDFKQYSVGKRSVYYTTNYYNYVPEDLSVSIDDLQKEIDDLSKVIDELLKQIQDNTDESEIEELLRQILEALKNQQGTGGGGSGGGDITVDIDLGTTNNWLSKIYTKVSQIFDKMSSSAGKTLDDVVSAIEDLSKMLKKYLSEITGDLDDIKGQLEEMSEQEFEEKTDSFFDELMDLFSEVGEVCRGKFPFSMLSDIQLLIARISGMSPEAAASYSYDVDMRSGFKLYSTVDAVSVNDGTDHGGGGSSRPGGSGFISVEHGGGGSVRDPVDQKDWAPIFTLPIVIERYGIEEYIILDMSFFNPVANMSRTLFLIMYIICLFNMTFKVMGLWGDLVG